jgi:hypothetical protein
MFRKILCKQLVIVVVSVLLGGGLVAEALPVSSVGDDGTSPSLVIVCGTPAEFAVVGNGAKASGQPVSLSPVDGQAGGNPSAGLGTVPEPSSLVLLGLGVLGMLGLTRVRRHWRRGVKVLLLVVLGGCLVSSVAFANEVMNATLPPAATLVSPSGTSCDTTPTYIWNAVSSATWYYLWVNGPSGPVIQQWYTAAQAGCASGTGTCAIAPATTLATGNHTWWIRTWNSSGYGPWSASKSFTVNPASPPGAVTLIAPSGSSLNPPPYYWWYEDSCATWYYLWVNGPSGNVIKQWYTAAQAHCDGTWCWVTNATALPGGTNTWWVQTWNSSGYGLWSNGMSFTVSAGFNSQFNGDMTGWQVHSGSWSIASSAYLTTTGMTNEWASVSYNAQYSNLDYQARLWRSGSASAINNLIIRGTPDPLASDYTWNNWYVFQYARNGNYSMYKVVNGVPTALQGWTPSSAINQGNAWNTLRVWARGSSLWFAINGTWVWNGTDTSFSSGRVGIGMYSDGTSGDQLWADWATLSVPSGAGSTAGADEHPMISAEQQALNAAANQHPVGSPERSPEFVILRKSGTGTGTITLGDQVCGLECPVLAVPYIEGARLTPQVVPAADSRFVGWQTKDGKAIEGAIFYAQPGDTVIAVFEKK